MPVYKHKLKNSWYASFYYVDWKGKRRRKKKEGFTTKKEAMEYERTFRAKTSNQCDMAFGAFVELYLQDCRKRLKFSTYMTKILVIEKFLVPYFDNVAISKITPVKIRNWQTYLLEHYMGYSNQYLRYINIQLSCIFNFARKFYGLTENPMKICKVAGGSKKKKIIFWTVSEFNRFIREVEEPFYTAFQILFWTGIRRGELLALRPKDFDFANKIVFIRRNVVLVNNQEFIYSPKTENSNRCITLPDFLLYIVKNYVEKRFIEKSERLFTLHPMYFTRCIKRCSEKANIHPIRMHDFRHSHVSLLIEEGFSPLLIAESLGHKSATTTLEIYAHLYPNKQRKLAEKLDKLYKND